jgi:hypothetical protein
MECQLKNGRVATQKHHSLHVHSTWNTSVQAIVGADDAYTSSWSSWRLVCPRESSGITIKVVLCKSSDPVAASAIAALDKVSPGPGVGSGDSVRFAGFGAPVALEKEQAASTLGPSVFLGVRRGGTHRRVPSSRNLELGLPHVDL